VRVCLTAVAPPCSGTPPTKDQWMMDTDLCIRDSGMCPCYRGRSRRGSVAERAERPVWCGPVQGAIKGKFPGRSITSRREGGRGRSRAAGPGALVEAGKSETVFTSW